MHLNLLLQYHLWRDLGLIFRSSAYHVLRILFYALFISLIISCSIQFGIIPFISDHSSYCYGILTSINKFFSNVLGTYFYYKYYIITPIILYIFLCTKRVFYFTSADKLVTYQTLDGIEIESTFQYTQRMIILSLWKWRKTDALVKAAFLDILNKNEENGRIEATNDGQFLYDVPTNLQRVIIKKHKNELGVEDYPDFVNKFDSIKYIENHA